MSDQESGHERRERRRQERRDARVEWPDPQPDPRVSRARTERATCCPTSNGCGP